jgi:hypothetical protein
VLHEYVLTRILERIKAEPDLLRRSILARRADDEVPSKIIDEPGALESGPRLVRQLNDLDGATVATMAGIEPEPFRLVVTYLIRRVYVSGPSLPLHEQIRIVWRVPEL